MKKLLYLFLAVSLSVSVYAKKPKKSETPAPAAEEVTVYDGKIYKKEGQPNNFYCKHRNRVCWIERDCSDDVNATCPVPGAKIISLYTDDGIETMAVQDVISLGEVEDPEIGEIVNAYEIIFLGN